MGEIKKILWPNDLSKCSEGALPYVVSLAKKYHAVVHVLYVAQDLAHHESWYGDFDKSHADRLIEWETKKARERQHKLCRKYLEDCAEYYPHIDIGNPARKIIDFIADNNIDMVVICRKGETGEFNMGGTAQKVIEYSTVPVVITPDL